MKTGPLFGENIRTGKTYFTKKSRLTFHHGPSMRSFLLPICIALFSLILLGKLFFLQIVQGQYYRNLSDSNRLRVWLVHAPRGIIFDTNGKPLVHNTPGFREIVNGKTQLLTQQEGIAKIAQGDSHLEVDSLREYPYKDVLAHIVGYIGQISPEELAMPQYAHYLANDVVGKLGIEEQYETALRGTDGQLLTEVDATGKILRVLGETDPIPGANITLTLDADLQQKVFDATSGIQKGAVVVSKPNGEILAMVSRPSFDPNLFTMGSSYHATGVYSNISQIISDNQNQPFLNRPIAGQYPPGSTFKLVTAAAALEDNAIDEHYTVDDTGVIKLGEQTFANWYYTDYGKVEGLVNVVKALQRSNDIFFYKVGALLGVDRLSAFAQKFGLGKPLGIDLPGEEGGLVPTKDWKKKVIGDNWYTGDDYQYGIGQGYLLATPLQVNTWTQAIANGGTEYQPHLLKNTTNPPAGEAGTTNATNTTNNPIRTNLLSDKNFNLIRQGMIAACSPGGVAYPLFNFTVKNKNLPIDGKNILAAPNATTSATASQSAEYRQVTVACKTGTAQFGTEATKPHAWITLFAPAYNPQIVVTVLVEGSGEGSTVAGPIAKKVLEAWFEK